MNNQHKVSDVLRDAILRAESLRSVARATGVDIGQLSRFCRGERGLAADAIDRLCVELGLELVRRRKRKPT